MGTGHMVAGCMGAGHTLGLQEGAWVQDVPAYNAVMKDHLGNRQTEPINILVNN